MNSQDFIKQNLDRIVAKYPFVQCTYQFDDFCNLHSVQVIPKDYLNNPEGFGDLQYSIKKDFVTHFPYERLSFFSTDNTIKIDPEKVVSIISGRYFKITQNIDIEFFPEDSVYISNVNNVLIAGDGNYALAA